jgi:hypothetical protein
MRVEIKNQNIDYANLDVHEYMRAHFRDPLEMTEEERAAEKREIRKRQHEVADFIEKHEKPDGHGSWMPDLEWRTISPQAPEGFQEAAFQQLLVLPYRLRWLDNHLWKHD